MTTENLKSAHSKVALTEAEELERLRDFFDNAAIGLHWVGPDGTILRANRADYEALGYATEEYVGHNITEFHADPDVIDDILARLSRGETLHDYEARLRCKDGAIRHVLIDSSVNFQGDEFINTRCLTRDVTLQRASEDTRRSVEEQLMLLVEASGGLIESPELPDMLPNILTVAVRLVSADAYAVWGLNAEGDEWRTLLVEGLSAGYMAEGATIPAEPTQSMPVCMAVQDVGSEPLLAGRLAGYQREGIRSLLVFALRFEGQTRGTLTFYYREPHVFSDAELRVGTALANLAASATALARSREREQASLARLENSNHKLALLARVSHTLSSSLDYEETLERVAYMAVPDLADWCSVNIVEASGEPRTVAVAHNDPEKVALARRLEERYPVDMEAPVGWPAVMRSGESQLIKQITEAMLAEVGVDDDLRALVADLGLRSSLIVPLIAHGKALGAITLVTADLHPPLTDDDVPLAEELARRAAIAIDNARLYRQIESVVSELQTANAVKDEFLGLVSHELRTPITTIYGNARLLRQYGLALDEESRTTALGDIEDESERLQRIIENMLILARFDATQEVETQPLSLEEHVSAIVAAFERRHAQREVLVEPFGALPLVAFEPTYLDLILTNLLSNADKCSEPGKPIEVRVARTDEAVEVHVLDRGAGVLPDELEELFSPFFRASRTKSSVRGMGIGLAVCKRLLDAQGCRIWGSPRVGGGSAFGFTVPIEPIPFD